MASPRCSQGLKLNEFVGFSQIEILFTPINLFSLAEFGAGIVAAFLLVFQEPLIHGYAIANFFVSSLASSFFSASCL